MIKIEFKEAQQKCSYDCEGCKIDNFATCKNKCDCKNEDDCIKNVQHKNCVKCNQNKPLLCFRLARSGKDIKPYRQKKCTDCSSKFQNKMPYPILQQPSRPEILKQLGISPEEDELFQQQYKNV